jgi:hypothetical protein
MKVSVLSGLVAAMGFGCAANAAEIEGCGDWRTQVEAVAEPWESNTRTFANGAIRAVVIDTIEPAAGSFFLVLMHPPLDETGSPYCSLISPAAGGAGFSGMDLAAAVADYDPASGLSINLPVGLYNEATAGFDDVTLRVTINQSTGDVVATTE